MNEKEYFKQDAKQIVDMLFDTKCFKDDVSRDDMNSVEDFIKEMMQIKFESNLKLKSLIDKINN